MTKAGMDKRIKEIMDRPYTRVLVPDETGGYVAEVLELPGCISEGDTPDEAIENLEDAMRGWLQVALEDRQHIPDPLEAGEYNGRILLRVPRSVHARCVRFAEADGVSLNQWLLEAIGERLGAEGFSHKLLGVLRESVSMVTYEEEVTTRRARLPLRLVGAEVPQSESATNTLLGQPGEGYQNEMPFTLSVAEKEESYNG